MVWVSVWVAMVGYLGGALEVCASGWFGARGWRVARVAWTLGLAAFLVHVVSAFDVHYAWSQEVAWRETARQTAEATGRATGVGLYFNYAFTLIWASDVAWSWGAPESHRRRGPWIVGPIHGFMFFMVFNGSVVFGSGPVRVLGALICLVVIAAWVGARLRAWRTEQRP